jgi:hypothetical protein
MNADWRMERGSEYREAVASISPGLGAEGDLPWETDKKQRHTLKGFHHDKREQIQPFQGSGRARAVTQGTPLVRRTLG